MQYLLFSRHFYMKRGKRYHVRKVFLMFLNSAEKQLLVISCGLKKEGIERYTLDIVIGYPNLSLSFSLSCLPVADCIFISQCITPKLCNLNDTEKIRISPVET